MAIQKDNLVEVGSQKVNLSSKEDDRSTGKGNKSTEGQKPNEASENKSNQSDGDVSQPLSSTNGSEDTASVQGIRQGYFLLGTEFYVVRGESLISQSFSKSILITTISNIPKSIDEPFPPFDGSW